MDVDVRLMRFTGDRLSELIAIEWKGNFGFDVASDLDRAEELLAALDLPREDREQHAKRLRRRRR